MSLWITLYDSSFYIKSVWLNANFYRTFTESEEVSDSKF